MAIASQTTEVKWALLRHLHTTGKELYGLLTQPRDITQTGPAFDTKIAALKAALTAAGY